MPLVTGTRSFQPSYILSIQFLASQHHQAPASIPTQVASAPFRVSLFNTSVSEQHPSQLEKGIQALPPPFQVPNTSALHPHHLSVTLLIPSPLGTHRTLVTSLLPSLPAGPLQSPTTGACTCPLALLPWGSQILGSAPSNHPPSTAPFVYILLETGWQNIKDKG